MSEPLSGVDRARFYGVNQDAEAAIRADEREKIVNEVADMLRARCESEEVFHSRIDNAQAQRVMAVLREQRAHVLALIQKPKTREQVLEEALREMVLRADRHQHGGGELSAKCWEIASAALDWKPPTG